MKHLAPILLCFGLLTATAHASPPAAPSHESPPAAPLKASPAPTVILVGLDGFRANSWRETDTPNFHRIASAGVSSELVPVFPSLSFPNLWTLVTGLYPEQHGIVANSMYDPSTGKTFSSSSFHDPDWWGGEPIWETAERQGLMAATTGWIGSDAKVGEHSQTYARPYSDTVPLEVRVDEVLAYLDLPIERRPSLITFYSDVVDNNSHIYGPGSPEELRAIREVDQALGRLLRGLEQRGSQDYVNLIIVSDHGMMPITPERRIVLDDYVDPDTLYADPAQGGIAYLWPKDGDIEFLRRALMDAPGLQLYRRDELPARFRNSNHARMAPLVAVAQPGWTISTRSDSADPRGVVDWRGMHGYDNSLPGMRALFLAAGPAFKRGIAIPGFSSTEVAALVANTLGIAPNPSAVPLEEAAAALQER